MRVAVFEHFGTWSSAMYTAFEITMAPGGFIKYREIIKEVIAIKNRFLIGFPARTV